MPNFVINHDEMANLAVLSANWHRKEVASSELPFEPLTKIKIKTRGRKMAKLMTLDNDRKSNLFVLESMMCKLASRKSFLILSLVLLSIGCFGPIKLVASSSSSSPTNFEQSFSGEGDSSNTGSSRLLQIGHQQLQSLSHSHHQQTPSSQQNQLPVSTTFDASNYRSIYEAIRNHPELREVSFLLSSSFLLLFVTIVVRLLFQFHYVCPRLAIQSKSLGNLSSGANSFKPELNRTVPCCALVVASENQIRNNNNNNNNSSGKCKRNVDI